MLYIRVLPITDQIQRFHNYRDYYFNIIFIYRFVRTDFIISFYIKAPLERGIHIMASPIVATNTMQHNEEGNIISYGNHLIMTGHFMSLRGREEMICNLQHQKQ